LYLFSFAASSGRDLQRFIIMSLTNEDEDTLG